MITSFKCKETEKIFSRVFSKKMPQEIQRLSYRKLIMLDAAVVLADLKIPPYNQLESLSGDRKVQHSIRINKQYRICFIWNDGNISDVEIVDYH